MDNVPLTAAPMEPGHVLLTCNYAELWAGPGEFSETFFQLHAYTGESLRLEIRAERWNRGSIGTRGCDFLYCWQTLSPVCSHAMGKWKRRTEHPHLAFYGQELMFCVTSTGVVMMMMKWNSSLASPNTGLTGTKRTGQVDPVRGEIVQTLEAQIPLANMMLPSFLPLWPLPCWMLGCEHLKPETICLYAMNL